MAVHRVRHDVRSHDIGAVAELPFTASLGRRRVHDRDGRGRCCWSRNRWVRGVPILVRLGIVLFGVGAAHVGLVDSTTSDQERGEDDWNEV